MKLLSKLLRKDKDYQCFYEILDEPKIDYLMKKLKQHDYITYEQSIRAGYIALQYEYSISEDWASAKECARAGLLHDIGKIHIPYSILNQETLLTAEEYSLIMQHCKIGAELLKKEGFCSLIVETALYHHECIFEKNNFKNRTVDMDKISVIGVADIISALMQEKTYRRAYTMEESFSILYQYGEKNFPRTYLYPFLENEIQVVPPKL